VTGPESGSPNLVEGREFYAPESVALDTSVTPPIVYVSDTGNNRVLAWKNATGFTNGQKADLVIGQPDFYSTAAEGPGQLYSTGLTQPTGLAVDSSGNLYVGDSGNNRILRYPKPFQQNQFPLTPNLYIGQPTLNTRAANYTGQVSASGIALSANNTLFQCFLAFDSSGNLWASDPGNARVLRFPNVANQTGGGMSADIVIGQANLTSTFSPGLPATQQGQNTTNQLLGPSGLAFDSAGRLYVADALSRVLVFAHPAAAPGNASADALLGVYPLGTNPTSLNQEGVTEFNSPSGIFFLADGSVGVVDSGFNRIVFFPPYAQWTQTPQPAIQPGSGGNAYGVVGQNLNFTSFNANASTLTAFTALSTPPPNAQTFWSPTSAVLLPGATPLLYVADTGNNRVLMMPVLNSSPSTGANGASTNIIGPASAILGQDYSDQYSVDLIEGREFDFDFQSGGSVLVDAGIALDTTGSTPHLYVADPYNHRILGFNDARKIQAGETADLVIGQPDGYHGLCNYPSGDPNQPTQSSLCRPIGVLVDAAGNLYVADSGNGRVLRFPAPFNNKGPLENADLVLGQQNFTTVVQDPGPATMKTPYGLAFTGTNGLLVSDQSFNRVLYFPFGANGTFAAGTDNGKQAAKVFGQPSFTAIAAGTGTASMNAPHHISTDTNGLLYVADSGNNRVLIFQDPANSQTQTTGAASSLQLPNLSTPRGIYVNPATGQIWVTSGATVTRYPNYNNLIFNPTPTGQVVDAVGNNGLAILAVTQDQYGDLFVADQYNRVVAYYQGLTALNAASLITVNPVMAPGVIASLFPLASTSQFGSNTATYSGYPVATSLGDIQVTVNGTPAPLYYVSPSQINMIVPMNAPTSGTAEFEVSQISTGQILGAFQVPMQEFAPGIFICSGNTSTLRAACVVNQDGSVNSASNPAPRGSVISIYATGQGVVPNAPPDGVPATSAISTPNTPQVILGSNYVSAYTPQAGEPLSNCPNFICYSGLNGYPGMWQINVEVPKGVPPSSTANALLDVVMQGFPAWAVSSSTYEVIVYIGQ